MPYTGRCACDAVTIRISGAARAVRQCWCRHCQQLAAGGPTHNVFFKAEDVTFDGEVVWNSHSADSGNTLNWAFCPKCGTQLMMNSSARAYMQGVRLGAIDLPHDLRPTAAIWTSEAPGWAVIDPALENFAAQPPAIPPSQN
ncbi:GFA family protein [Sphingobium subterraneum]|uniref:CENP-V/GFA domain-containing protein n=1 Tax=Sphingobium subterraneum TaxID=627688 RepID=A0A841IW07_9SPHN|nr:GFA family protein [Sphingobium subterraneum]MBB6122450.1 hypothetical protein [Sphingobium subterraneum]